MDVVKEYGKAIAGFLVALFTQALIDFFQNGVAIPQTGAEWLRYLGTASAVALGVAGTRNKLTPAQVTKGLPELGAVAASAVAAAVPAMAEQVQEQVAGGVLQALPPQVRDVVGKYPFWR